MWRLVLLVHVWAALVFWPAHALVPDAAPAGASPAVQPSEHDCAAAVLVRIRAVATDDAQAACDGAQRALAFLHEVGLELPRDTLIQVVEQLPADVDGKAVGCYLPATRRIMLLTYRAFEATGTWFQVPVAPELYRAAASHEVAHAMIACNSESGRLPLAAHEYVAYVTMFATMEPRLRQQILAHYPGRGLTNSLQIHLFMYLVDPLKFAADAWRHYLRQPDPAAWLRDIVAGRVVEEWPADAP